MKYYIMIFSCILILSCKIGEDRQKKEKNSKIDLLFEKRIEHSLISRGNNFPDFYPSKDSIDFFLFSLHENISITEFKEKTNFTVEKISEIEKLLKSKNWLHYIDNKPKPSVFIATQTDGEKLFEYGLPIANEIVDEIENELPNIKEKFTETKISKTQNFKKWSFLILSNVLLDSWQIKDVEREFLGKETRPERNGKNYYYSIRENENKKRESFGIYGNQYEEKDGKTISIYGNSRIGITLKSSENIISNLDNEIFKEIANNFTQKLIDILNKNDDYIRKIYKETGYQKEITFEEFFIWWYHFIYTKATDIMNESGILTIPENGNFEYEINK